MDIQLDAKNFLSFLRRCNLEGMVKDLVIFASNGKIFSRFVDKTSTMYCEVYEPKVKIMEEGNIKISSLKNLMAIVSRSDSEVIRLKSSPDMVAITDGSKVGKFKADIIQSGDAEVIESFQGIKDRIDIFDKESLRYTDKFQYEVGVVSPIEILNTILKDAKAFGYELYKIDFKKDVLKCVIENQHTGEKFARNMADKGWIGDPNKIPSCSVGAGFREVIASIGNGDEEGGAKEGIRIYFLPEVWLITNGSTFFYNIATVGE